MKRVKVGIIGFGTIGIGVVKALKSRRALLAAKTGVDISIARICDKDLKTRRPVKVDKKLLTKSIAKVLYDPEIDIVVELIGGITPAKDVVLEALRQGKHVVTANKALLAKAGHEIFCLAGKLGLSVGFEASVGGGIPIIRALSEGFVADKIELIYGIINGTSNFVLSKMAEEGLDFNAALAMARKRGYAEPDPSLDINGGDSCHKLSILALLGFGVAARPADIYTEGIAHLEAVDIQYACESGYAVKLLAIAKRSAGSLELRVHPTLVPSSHLLSGVNGVYNAIFVKGDLIGETLFYGQGAGAEPTSSAVISDIIAISKAPSYGLDGGMGGVVIGASADPPSLRSAGSRQRLKPLADNIRKMDEVRTKHYIRFSTVDKPGVLAKISGILAKYKISISCVIQKQRESAGVVPIIMMTHEARERDMAKAIKEIDALSVVKRRCVRVRVEG